MNILNGVKNFLVLVNDNWTTIVVLVGLAFAIARKIKSYFGKTNEEKIEIAKAQIKETILNMVAVAEFSYDEWNKAGSVKRADVISQIYSDYPVLSKVVDQQALIAWVDDIIDESLETLNEVVAGNKKKDETVVK